MYVDIPPCLVPGQGLNPCARALYTWRVTGHGELPGDWAGWRLAGRYLVTPDGDRISPQRLRGLMFLERNRLHLVKIEKRRHGVTFTLPRKSTDDIRAPVLVPTR